MTLVRGLMEDFCNLHLFLPLHYKGLKKDVWGGHSTNIFLSLYNKGQKNGESSPIYDRFLENCSDYFLSPL